VVLRHYLSGREEVLPDVAAVLWIRRQAARSRLFNELKTAGMDRTLCAPPSSSALLEAHSVAKYI
jgi:hypothetical protein